MHVPPGTRGRPNQSGRNGLFFAHLEADWVAYWGANHQSYGEGDKLASPGGRKERRHITMKKIGILLLCVLFSFPALGLAAGRSPDLSGSWNLTITKIDKDGNLAVTSTTMALTKSTANPNFYSGLIGAINPITVFQDGHMFRFTTAIQDLNDNNYSENGYYRASSYGTGIVGQSSISGSFGDELGGTGTIKGSR
jgi:hypothetical protein